MLHLLKKKLFEKSLTTKKLARPWKFWVKPSAAIYFFFGFCCFPDTSGRAGKHKSGSGEAEKLATAGEKRILRISQEATILRPIQKNPYFVIFVIISCASSMFICTYLLFIKNPIIFQLLKNCYIKLHQVYFKEFNMPFKNVRLWEKDFL